MSFENAMLMDSLLDPTSPTFFNWPLPHCLFSGEDTGKLSIAIGIKLRLKFEKSESNYDAFLVKLPGQKFSLSLDPTAIASTPLSLLHISPNGYNLAVFEQSQEKKSGSRHESVAKDELFHIGKPNNII